ncbi:MAG TPA: PrgI family protein [Patescibacteria group bacterium]|nr:PrgI family protein [Patescibacteria group bacterium]
MEQHAIPQNVSSYQFKLVGDMTLKQFFQLAGGILVAIIIYSLPLLGIIKWPFAILSVLLGIGLAFLPLEERPLEKWIFAFFRAIYAPTIFSWQKAATPPKFFQDESPTSSTPQQDLALKSYLGTTAQVSGALGNLEKAENGFLAKLTALFSGIVNPTPATQITPAATLVPEKSKEMQIPETQPIRIQANATHLVVEEKPTIQTVQSELSTSQVAPIIAGNEMISTKQAMFSIDAAPPSPPSQPNVVVGQIVDQDRKIVEGAIMEIRDSMGRPIRALRSNRAGHFITVTQLDNGHYEIITEKDGYEFAAVSFDANGNLIPPILVQGKRIAPIIEPVPTGIVKPAYSIN